MFKLVWLLSKKIEGYQAHHHINMSWDDDIIPKACTDFKKSPSTLAKNMARKQKYLQERNSKEDHKHTAKDKTLQIEIRCEECNLKVNSKKQLHSHKLQKHKTNKIVMCEYCKKKIMHINMIAKIMWKFISLKSMNSIAARVILLQL